MKFIFFVSFFILTIYLCAAQRPSIGNYPNTTVTASGNTIVTPDSFPTNTSFISVIISTSFTGVITADPVSGILRMTDAQPAGIYVVTLSVDTFVTKTFLLTVTNPACSNSNFITNPVVSANARPMAVAIGDFNNDGKQDFAIANINANNVSVRIGNGLGGFTNASDVSTGLGPYHLAIGDFNRDGKQDIATANYNAASVSIRLGNGSGGFTGTTNVSIGAHPYWIAIGDFNNDGKQDFATANYTATSVSIRFGDGTGGFSGTTNIIVSSYAEAVVVGDFNGDNNQDLAVSGLNNVSILLGNGSGSFTAQPDIIGTNNNYSVVIGDFNTDGKQDLVYTNSVPPTAVIQLGDGLGGFTSAPIVTVGNFSDNIVIGDFNGDGFQDLATSLYASVSGAVTIRNGDGAAGFSGNISITVGSQPYSLAVGDLNSDGLQDLVVPNSNSNNVSILLGSKEEINIKSNNNDIPDGNTSIALSNNTDFGVHLINTPTSKVYTIQNTGTRSLTVSNITIAGTNAAEFIRSGITLPATITAGSSTTFSITFTPISNGVRTSVVHISNSDCDETDYDFALNGTGYIICPGNISDGNNCTVDACDSINGITHTPVNTNDNNVCTTDACNPVSGITHTLINFNDNNVCTTDACDPVTGPSHIPVNTDDSIAFTVDGCDSLTGIFHNEIFNLKVYLEGYYTGNGLMDNSGRGGCLYIAGLNADSAAADSIQLTLVDPITLSPEESSFGLLNTNGNAGFNFHSTVTGDYYLKVNHRNSIETWSASPVSLIATNYYDFTIADSLAYGSNMTETFDNNGWTFYSGDITDSTLRIGFQDGIIGIEDYSRMEDAVDYIFLGYNIEDLTGDGVVESKDFNLMENNFNFLVVSMHP